MALGDTTLSVLEIWGAEYQENDCILIRADSELVLAAICARERCLFQVIGHVTGSGRIVVKDPQAEPEYSTPVDMDLEKVLGKMPRKTFEFVTSPVGANPLTLPEDATPVSALQNVLKLPSVCSKRFLTTKVDRCVSGLVAQQ